MISLLLSEPRPSEGPSQLEPSPSQAGAEAGEFEIVVGRRQIASISLVMVVLLAVFSGISYLIGKTSFAEAASTAPAAVEPIPPVPAPSVEQAQSPPQAQPQSQAEAQPQPSQPAKTPDAETLDAPLFDYPVPGAVYIQVGAVERALCRVWAEGLRTHGLRAFVAPGPNDKIFRVLIGPLPNPDAYQHAKEVLDRIGLATFGRRYQI